MVLIGEIHVGRLCSASLHGHDRLCPLIRFVPFVCLL